MIGGEDGLRGSVPPPYNDQNARTLSSAAPSRARAE
jgi:hypothetical protein